MTFSKSLYQLPLISRLAITMGGQALTIFNRSTIATRVSSYTVLDIRLMPPRLARRLERGDVGENSRTMRSASGCTVYHSLLSKKLRLRVLFWFGEVEGD